MTIYLYIKHCNHCDLKYFGKTTKDDPYKYIGSGTHWLRHLKKHGKEHIVTDWVKSFESQEECTKFALLFSKENDIVNSKNWANLCEENGKDGGIIGRKLPKSVKEKIKNNHADFSGSNNPMFGKKISNETRKKMSLSASCRKISNVGREALKARTKACIKCNQILPVCTINRWHNERCKS